MTDWTDGYVADIGYTYGYYAELNPLRVKLAFLNNGLIFPEFGTACELGFGQGISANIHAAATVTKWSGTDFNPSQAAFAQELEQVCGSSAQLFDQSFAEFALRSDLPDFDYIGLHGIWSWINDENRAIIVDFIKRKLKVGGVLYISYNTQPGWAAMVPMRDLLTEHSQVMGSSGQGIVPRIEAALSFAEKLLATNPIYARANPLIAERVGKMKTQSRNYLAHEYFNLDWKPMSFADMASWLEPAKMGYACSANYLDHMDAVNLTQEQLSLLNDIPDAMFRQTVRDFMVNQNFRKDYWVKGARKLNTLEQAERLSELKIILTTPRNDVSLKINGALGQGSMQEDIYKPILDVLATHKAFTLAKLAQNVKEQNINFSQIVQAVMVLSAGGHISCVQEDAQIKNVKQKCDKLNDYLISKARTSGEITFLASPVIGSGVVVGRFQQLFLMALKQGKTKPEEWAAGVDQILRAQNQKIVKDGKPLETQQEQLAELTTQAIEFAEKRLPILKALQIA